MSRRKTSPRVINVIMLFTGMLIGYALVTLVISLYDSYRASPATIEISTQEIPAEAEESQTWDLDIPIKKNGSQFIGFRVKGHMAATWAPECFNKITGQDEHGHPEMLIMGYVEGPTNFQLKIPTDIKEVEVEVGIPGAGGHKFTVTQ